MTGVAELLAGASDFPPVQRVRNYHLTDREAVPRPRDFLTAMKRTDGELAVRWAGPPGQCFVGYADPDWERVDHDRFRGRTTVETVEADRVRTWLRGSRPELVLHDDVRASFEADASPPETSPPDPSPPERSVPAHATAPSRATDPAAAVGGTDAGETVRVRRRADLRADSALDAADAEAVEAALPASPAEFVFRLPLALAEEVALAPTAESDRVFVAERVPGRETDRAYYARQGPRSAWVPKADARVYELCGNAFDAANDRRCGSV